MGFVWEISLREFFGVENLHEHQISTLQSLPDGRDVFLSVRTGGGKSLCYMGFPVAAKAQTSQRQRETAYTDHSGKVARA